MTVNASKKAQVNALSILNDFNLELIFKKHLEIAHCLDLVSFYWKSFEVDKSLLIIVFFEEVIQTLRGIQVRLKQQ